VQKVASAVASCGGNWEASRMSHLAGRFAGLLQAAVDADRAEELTAALRALHAEGLTVVVERGSAVPPTTDRWLRLALTGTDRPGIVRDVSRILASKELNIEEFSTQQLTAPMSGELLFTATADLRCPAQVSFEELRRALEHLADDLMVDISLEEKPRASR
jgi:glycine cleavage system regulatory protein